MAECAACIDWQYDAAVHAPETEQDAPLLQQHHRMQMKDMFAFVMTLSSDMTRQPARCS